MLQEVFRTELVYPQEKGEVQASLIPSYFNNSEEKLKILPLEVEYGITDVWQVGFAFNLFTQYNPLDGPGGSGIGDLDIETKYSFMNIGGSNYHVALLFDIGLPIANINKGLTDGFQLYEPSIAFAKDFPSLNNSQLFGQIGFSFVNRVKSKKNTSSMKEQQSDPEVDIEGIVVFVDEPAAHTFFLNAGYFLPIGISRYVIEVNWETNQWNNGGEENQIYITPGIVWELPRRWEIALGGSIGFTPTSDKYDLFLRATYEFDLFS